MGQSSIIYVWFVTLGDGERSSLQSPSASCASSVLVSREDRPPCPGSSLLLLGSLHSCFFSSHSVPCHLCVTQPCVVLGPGGAVGQCQGDLLWGRGGAGCAGGLGWHGLCCPGCALCCSVLAELSALWGRCLSLCRAGGQRGARGVTSPAPRRVAEGSLPTLPVTQLFIHPDERM